MINPYLALFLLMLVVAGFLITMLVLSSIIGPKEKGNDTKELPFECGAVSVGKVSEQRFSVRFYLVAMLFILFDIEVIFMYPWAMALPTLGWYGYLQMLTFMAILTVGLVYVWRKGVLNWND